MAAKKGSKTAHVLNVLSGPKQDAPEEAQEELDTQEGGTERKAMPSRPMRVPILEVARSNDDALSEKIRDLLEEDFTAELVQQENKKEEVVPEEKEEQEETEEQGKKSSDLEEAKPQNEIETERMPTTDSEAQEISSISEEEESKATEEENSQVSQPILEDFCCVNVMEALVEETCMKYINMFGLCSCSRCVADVKALALTNLPAKYLVMHKGTVIPMLTVFGGKYSTALTAQIINACKVVMQNPRH